MRLGALIVSLLAGLAAQAVVAAERPFNVVVLLVDDWGWTDAGSYGSDLYETPHIDALAETGMRFTDAYSASTVCSPTRAALMTGQYPGRNRVTDWIPGHVREDAPLQIPDWTQRLEHRHVTIAEALRQAGYRTAHVGKWHLTPRSDAPEVVADYYPNRHGFELNVAGNQWGQPGSYFWPFRRSGREGLRAQVANFPEGGQEGDYLTDTLTDQVLGIIEGFRDEPFFVYFPYYTVHTPIQGKPELVERYRQKLKPRLRHSDPEYAAMVSSLDESVGRVTARLEELGLAERTVIFLTGDNGGLDLRGKGPTKNHPLRSGKGSAYEGGVRVPLIARWPGVTPPGSVSHEPVITVDLYPTLLEIAGAPEPDAALDGLSLAPVLADPAARLEREALYWHYPHYHPGGATPYSAIRARDWRLVEFHEDMRVELYDLARDIGESRDLAAEQPARAAELRRRLHDWRRSVAAQMPTESPSHPAAADPAPRLERFEKEALAEVQKRARFTQVMVESNFSFGGLGSQESIMARLREGMREYDYDPSRYDTYLEQLGIEYPTVRDGDP